MSKNSTKNNQESVTQNNIEKNHVQGRESLKSITEEYQKVCFMYPKKEKGKNQKKKKQRQARCDRINIQVEPYKLYNGHHYFALPTTIFTTEQPNLP
jgi:hypothetical protein